MSIVTVPVFCRRDDLPRLEEGESCNVYLFKYRGGEFYSSLLLELTLHQLNFLPSQSRVKSLRTDDVFVLILSSVDVALHLRDSQIITEDAISHLPIELVGVGEIPVDLIHVPSEAV